MSQYGPCFESQVSSNSKLQLLDEMSVDAQTVGKSERSYILYNDWKEPTYCNVIAFTPSSLWIEARSMRTVVEINSMKVNENQLSTMHFPFSVIH